MGELLPFTEAEREFYKAFVTILEHLKNRAIKAENEARDLRRELEKRRDQVEYYSLVGSSPPHDHVPP